MNLINLPSYFAYLLRSYDIIIMASKSESPEVTPNKLKDLLTIQLEVTERLLESEEHRLKLLKTEIQVAKHRNRDVAVAQTKDKELELQENTLVRIRLQYQRLSQEMQAMGVIQRRKLNISRSLPAIGMKQTSKRRPSLFDHYIPKEELMTAKLEEVEQLHSKEPPTSPIEIQSGLFTPQQLAEELEYKDGLLVAGSLDGLVQLLIPLESYYPDVTFVFAFLLCSRLYIQPHTLLNRVIRIFQYIYRQNFDVESGAKYLQLVRDWIEKFPYDFRDEKMMRALKVFGQFCGSISPKLQREVGQLQASLIQRLSTLDKYEYVLSQVNIKGVEKMIDPHTQVNILQVCDNAVTLAQQLTHIELERLNNIGPEEFVQTFVKTPSESADMKRTSNIEAYVEWFNRLSYLVATEICVSDKERDRAKVMDFFLDVALECKKLYNFNSFMAIAAGLYMSPVIRLKKLRAKLNKKKFEEVENFLDPSSNFAIYRQELRSATEKARAEKKCVVPLFSLIIKDLYFENQSQSNKLPNGWIRFEKCIALARLVSQTLTWKNVVLPYDRKRLLLNYLMTVPIHTDEELLLVSYEIEAPETPNEKQRYQQLKGLHGSYARCIGKQGGGSSVSGAVSFTGHPMYKRH